LGVAALNFLLLIGVGFLISHRLAGPVFRLKKFLAEMDGDTKDFSLREGDYLKELEPVVNKMKDQFKAKT
jgi:hypothetical protein